MIRITHEPLLVPSTLQLTSVGFDSGPKPHAETTKAAAIRKKLKLSFLANSPNLLGAAVYEGLLCRSQLSIVDIRFSW